MNDRTAPTPSPAQDSADEVSNLAASIAEQATAEVLGYETDSAEEPVGEEATQRTAQTAADEPTAQTAAEQTSEPAEQTSDISAAEAVEPATDSEHGAVAVADARGSEGNAGHEDDARNVDTEARGIDDEDADDHDADDRENDGIDNHVTAAERLRRLEEEGDIAADYLEELLDIADLDGDLDIDVDGDRASIEIRNAEHLSRMNAPRGELLDALQELTRLAVQTRTGNRSRLMLDIGGYREQRKADLEDLAAATINDVRETGQKQALRPMNPFERKIVHDAAKSAGLHSESDGDGKNRHVVIYPDK